MSAESPGVALSERPPRVTRDKGTFPSDKRIKSVGRGQNPRCVTLQQKSSHIQLLLQILVFFSR